MNIYADGNKGENICFSGGAQGADLAFGAIAQSVNHKVIHYHFEEKYSNRLFFNILSDELLTLADPFVKRANKKIKRKFPSSSIHTNNLLRRNFYQIKDSNSVYAVAPLDSETGFVKGGTAWACQMFLDRNPYGDLYLFDIISKNWLTWIPIQNRFHLMDEKPLMPSGKWTGIGSRFIDKIDEIAIYKLFT
jgi:hypothetical protein